MTKSNSDAVTATVRLPANEARDLTIHASRRGISTPEYLGYHVLRSAYGFLHPSVRAFEARDILGQTGTHKKACADERVYAERYNDVRVMAVPITVALFIWVTVVILEFFR